MSDALLTAPSREKRPMNPRAVQRFLAAAVEGQAAIRLRIAQNLGAPVLSGIVAGEDAKRLTLRIDHPETVEWSAWPRESWQATLELNGRRYRFATALAGELPSPETRVLCVRRPDTLVVEERRRSRRRRFQLHAEVTLQTQDRMTSDGLHGTLLNLSLDGLACLIPATEKLTPPLDTILRCQIHAGSREEALVIPARVVSVTPGGTEGMVILGLAFANDKLSASGRKQLTWILAAADHPDAEGMTA